MSLNASRMRYTARSLHISTGTVLSELKKKEPSLKSVNTALLHTLNPDDVTVDIERAGEAEMWSFVRRKTNPRWLRHAIDHQTGKMLAYRWGAYTRHLDPEQPTTSKRYTQKIERKHLTRRTRIKRLTRKTICFSESMQMHDIVIGLFVN